MCNVYYMCNLVPLNCIHIFSLILITLISIFFPYNLVAILVQQDPLPKGRMIGENDSILRNCDQDLEDDSCDNFKVYRFIISLLYTYNVRRPDHPDD